MYIYIYILYIYVYIYIYTYTHTHTHIYVYIYRLMRVSTVADGYNSGRCGCDGRDDVMVEMM